MKLYDFEEANEKYDYISKVSIVKYFIDNDAIVCLCHGDHCTNKNCFLHQREYNGIDMGNHLCCLPTINERMEIAKEILEREMRKSLSRNQMSFDF